jgi:hypothetical protein
MTMMKAARETAQTAATHYVDVNGNRIAYRSIGTGSPMILLTRVRGTLDTWDPLLLDQLAEAHRSSPSTTRAPAIPPAAFRPT